jgi:hypothetical protein
MQLALRLALAVLGLAILIGSARRLFLSKGLPVNESALQQRSVDRSRLNWFAVLIGYGAFAIFAVEILNVPDPLPTILAYGAGALVLVYFGSAAVAGWKEGMRDSSE